MPNNKVVLEFYPPHNLPSFGRLTLKVNLDKIHDVKGLKSKLAKKLNYYQQCITLHYQSQPMPDQTPLQDYKLNDGDSILIFLSKRQYQVPKNVEPLKVGGLDLTDIKELSHLLKKKDFSFINQAFKDTTTIVKTSKNPPPSSMKQDQGDIYQMYSQQIETIKSVLGIEEKDKILSALLTTDGNVEQAIDLLLSSP